MIAPPFPSDEQERINELYRYEFRDKAYQEEFDEIVRLASGICNVPMSLITLIDIDKQWFKAKVGIEGEETSRSVAFCAHAILQDDLFEVKNAIEDARFVNNPNVTDDPNIRYYAGMPLVTDNGYKLGTLCVLDRVPRELSEEQYNALKVLSRQVIKLFELRVRNKELDKARCVQQKMMTIMAHDIRGPLSSLQSVFEFKMLNVLSEADLKEIEGLVATQLNSTIDLLNNIVDWGKLQLGHKVCIESFDLYPLVQECFGYFLLTAGNKQNRQLNRVQQGSVINAHRQGLEFVLRNLLGNAHKFTSGGTISVGMENNEDTIFIEIKDTGKGMEPHQLEALARRDWTGTTKGTLNEKGNGMGIQLVNEYLSGIDGYIHFESVPGAGTSATIVFPQYKV